LGNVVEPEVHATQTVLPVPDVYVPAPQVLHVVTEAAARAVE